VSTESVVSAIRESAETRTPFRISGRGAWLDAGRPVRAHNRLSLRDDTGIVSYVPGDLTLTVRAGTTLSEIENVTREHDQWLPLDPYGSPDGTIGATIATASAGPLASSFGLPRDLLLGLEFVNGRGEVVRGGGKVVKNVAGFDLSRLLTGSWGTLGVITEVTVRLYARPRTDRTFAVVLTGSERERTGFIHAMYASLTPYSMQLLSVATSRALGLGENPVCLVRLGGNDAVVAVQLKALSQGGRPQEADTQIWATLRQLDASSESVIRISSVPVRFLGTAARILGEDVPGIYTYIDPRRGVMRIVVGSGSKDDTFANLSTDPSDDLRFNTNGSSEIIFEKLPADVWATVSPSVVSDPLSQGIKQAYDPFDLLNPGILGD
jgi:FAD/FMN-containing dehydrogenase